MIDEIEVLQLLDKALENLRSYQAPENQDAYITRAISRIHDASEKIQDSLETQIAKAEQEYKAGQCVSLDDLVAELDKEYPGWQRKAEDERRKHMEQQRKTLRLKVKPEEQCCLDTECPLALKCEANAHRATVTGPCGLTPGPRYKPSLEALYPENIKKDLEDNESRIGCFPTMILIAIGAALGNGITTMLKFIF